MGGGGGYCWGGGALYSVELNPFLLQDGRCAYNVTMRRVLATIVAVEQQYVLHILGVCLALDIQHTMRHIVICGCTVFSHIISQTAGFSKKKITEHKVCILIFSKTFA